MCVHLVSALTHKAAHALGVTTKHAHEHKPEEAEKIREANKKAHKVVKVVKSVTNFFRAPVMRSQKLAA